MNQKLEEENFSAGSLKASPVTNFYSVESSLLQSHENISSKESSMKQPEDKKTPHKSLPNEKDKKQKNDGHSKEIKKHEFHISAKWEWLACNYELKREAKGFEIYWNLSPSIQLTGGDSELAPRVDIGLSLERAFMHSEELGWNWHKSWNLPSIKVTIKITDIVTNTNILPPMDLKAELMAVKVLSNKAEQFKLFDIGLKGAAVQDLSEGQTVFSGLKFNSTSYNNDGVKFHLVVLVYVMEDQRSGPKIVYSRISPPVFVDSRKSARDSNEDRSKKLVHKYFDPFGPEIFEKTFIKRNSRQSDSKEELIENSLEGLWQYFTAPNIRNKVKHPIFLAVKFANCVKLYYSTKVLKSKGKEEEVEDNIVETMQRQFLDNHYKSRSKNGQSLRTKSAENKPFILLVEEQSNKDSFHLNKKISDYLEPIQNEVIHIFFSSSSLPTTFVPLAAEKLAKLYSSNYNLLVGLKNSYGGGGYDGEDSDSGSSAKGDESNHMQADSSSPGPSQTEIANCNIKRAQYEPPLSKRFKREEADDAIEEEQKEAKDSKDSKVKMEEELLHGIKEEHVGFSAENTPNQGLKLNSGGQLISNGDPGSTDSNISGLPSLNSILNNIATNREMSYRGYQNNLPMKNSIDNPHNPLLGGNNQTGNINELLKKQMESQGLRQQTLQSNMTNMMGMSNWNGNSLINQSSNQNNLTSMQSNDMFGGNNAGSWVNNGYMESNNGKSNDYMNQVLRNMQRTGGQSQINGMALNNFYGTNQVPNQVSNQRIDQGMGQQNNHLQNHIKAAQLAQANDINKFQMLGALNGTNTLINQNTRQTSNSILSNNPLIANNTPLNGNPQLNNSSLFSNSAYGNSGTLQGLNSNMMVTQNALNTNPLMSTSNPLMGGSTLSTSNGLNSINTTNLSRSNQLTNPLAQINLTNLNTNNSIMSSANQAMFQKNFGQTIDPNLQAKIQMGNYSLTPNNPRFSSNLFMQNANNGMPYLNNFDKRPF